MGTVRRGVATILWMGVGAGTVLLAARGFFAFFGVAGRDLSRPAVVAAGVGWSVLFVAAVLHAGAQAYRGRLPWTGPTNQIGSEDKAGMMKRVLGVLGLVLVSSAVSAIVAAGVGTAFVAEMRDDGIAAGTVDWVIPVESEVLGERRRLRVQLPPGYEHEPDRRYPLLLVLDAGSHQEHTAEVSEVLLRLGLAEPVIVVGVVNGAAGRSVDFVPPRGPVGSTPGRADQFLSFLENEALPAIDQRLRTNGVRLITGNSLGGLFVTYSLIERPDLFDGRFAFSPSWWHTNQAIVADLEAFLAGGPTLGSYFYTSLGAGESSTMHDAFRAGVSALEASPAGLTWKAEYTPDSDHGNNAVHSTPGALRGYWQTRE